MICKTCGEEMQGQKGYGQTLVGYCSPPGHNHDDNCRKRTFSCKNGHSIVVSIRRRCDAVGCDWVGKETCDCHAGVKVDKWPDEVAEGILA